MGIRGREGAKGCKDEKMEEAPKDEEDKKVLEVLAREGILKGPCG